MKILLTTTSFQDTPGPHHELLASKGYEIVRARGPLPETKMLGLVGNVDALLCGDDEITEAVMKKSLPRLKVISKYGIGLDRIDLENATTLKIPVTYTPGVNHTSVAEHTFGLMLACSRKIVIEANYVAQGNWKRITGSELFEKTIGLIGFGRIAKEVALRAKAFGMRVIVYNRSWENEYSERFGVERVSEFEALFGASDVISIHIPATPETKALINQETLKMLKPGAIIVNTSRGEIVDKYSIRAALDAGTLAAYASDVLDQEPPPKDHPLLGSPNCILTPHIGSRTQESVVRQANMSIRNLFAVLEGKNPEAQANAL
ncbi:MAG: phosphoglycerate dehydrogenase [Verrucomicrobiota bacterium]